VNSARLLRRAQQLCEPAAVIGRNVHDAASAIMNTVNELPPSAPRPWHSATAQSFRSDAAASFAGRSMDDLDADIHRLVDAQERHIDDDCINLYAGTNAPNPRIARLLGSSIGSRPNLGAPGDTYNRGMDDGSRLSILCDALVGSLFGASYVETRVTSGSIANMYAYLATCKPGDHILAFSDAAAGHVTHHRDGAAGYCGLTTHDIAYDVDRMDVDLARFADQVERVKPKLIIVAGSMCLFPYSLREVRTIADTVGAYVLYDAAHMGGIIAGGRFQSPLAEGAHLLTGSTYKSFGGPPSGMILTNDADLAERLDRIAHPGFTANFDLAKTAALALAARDMHTYGHDYASTCIANAQALATAFAAEGVAVHDVAGRAGHPDLLGGHPWTVSQHVALRAASYGGGDRAAKLLERANLLCSSIGLPVETAGSVEGDANGIRLGTQEVTRRGLTPNDMSVVASLFACGLRGDVEPETLRATVREFRRSFTGVHFVSKGPTS
jgi:glycine hydroxymethyltransferase